MWHCTYAKWTYESDTGVVETILRFRELSGGTWEIVTTLTRYRDKSREGLQWATSRTESHSSASARRVLVSCERRGFIQVT